MNETTKISRRNFLKITGITLGGIMLGATPKLGFCQTSIYQKHGFKDSLDYSKKGAPFIKGNLSDWVEDTEKQYGSSPYKGASLDIVIKGDKRAPHYMMSRHSGVVKAALQSNIGIPEVNTLLHFDAHDDIHLTWKTIPPNNPTQEQIHDYSENVATYGGWINPLAYLGKFKKVVHIVNDTIPGHENGRRRTLYVSRKGDQFQLSFDVPTHQIVKKIEWVELVKPTAEALKKEIGNQSWAFSVCNDFYVSNYNHVVKNSPRDVANPISIENDVVPLVNTLKQLPSPSYAVSNISPNYAVSPNSFETCKFIEETMFIS